MSERRSRTLLTVGFLVILCLVASACGPTSAGKPGGTAKPGAGSPSPSLPPGAKPDPRYEMPRTGQCHRMTSSESRAPVATAAEVSCSRPHNTVIAYVGLVPGALTAQTPLARRRTIARQVCEPAFRRVAGGTPAARATSILTWAFFTPSQQQLEHGARWVRCDLLARSGNDLVQLPATTPVLRRGIPQQLRVCQNRQGSDVSCAGPHQFRVEAVFRPRGNAYPSLQAFTPVARNRCKLLMGGYGGYWQPPSRGGWAAGDHFVRCLSRKG